MLVCSLLISSGVSFHHKDLVVHAFMKFAIDVYKSTKMQRKKASHWLNNIMCYFSFLPFTEPNAVTETGVISFQ